MDYKKKKIQDGSWKRFFFLVLLLFLYDLCGDILRGWDPETGTGAASVQRMVLHKGWKKQDITLPAELPAPKGEKLILYNESLGAESRGMTVVSTGAQYDLVIRLNGKILYQYKEALFAKIPR